MKTVRLFKNGRRTEYDDSSADWLVQRGYGEYVPDATPPTPKAEPVAEPADPAPPPPPAPRRGRPPKAK